MMKNDIGKRFKENYENIWKIKLPRRLPMIIRLDGKAFHSLTRSMQKPFDSFFIECMMYTARKLVKEIAGTRFAYIQSDEISLLVHDYNKLNTAAWFDKEIQKICSISASIASVEFSYQIGLTGYFDSRCFILPENEVNNYFVWRQRDWIRNSIQMMGQHHFSHKQLQNKSCKQIIEMLFEAGHPWEDLEKHLKNGIGLTRTETLKHLDRFSSNSDFINQFLFSEE